MAAMPVTMTGVTAAGSELQWNLTFETLDRLVEFIRDMRTDEPAIVRVVVDIALPVTGPIP